MLRNRLVLFVHFAYDLTLSFFEIEILLELTLLYHIRQHTLNLKRAHMAHEADV